MSQYIGTVDRHNRKTFRREDCARAKRALSLYMSMFNSGLLRLGFEVSSTSLAKNLPWRGNPTYLVSALEELEELICSIEFFGSREALVLGRYGEETVTRKIDPKAAPAYRNFERALERYAEGLLKESDVGETRLYELALEVALIVNPNARQGGDFAATFTTYGTDFGVRWYLEAVESMQL